MGNQARVDEGSVVFSTSTRNFDNRLGKNAQVFLGSAELAAVCALLGKIPEVEEYQDITKNKINPYSDELYRYLQFDEIHDFSLSKWSWIMPNLIKENIQKTSNNSSRSIKKLLRQRSLVVALSLLLTGLGASITSISFKTGIYFINNCRLALLDQFPSIAVLPIFWAIGGAIAGYLIKNIAPAAKGSGVSQIMGFLRQESILLIIGD